MSLVMSPMQGAALSPPGLPDQRCLRASGSTAIRFHAETLAILIPASAIGIPRGLPAWPGKPEEDVVRVVIRLALRGRAFVFSPCACASGSSERRRPRPADVPRGIVWGTVVRLHQFCLS